MSIGTSVQVENKIGKNEISKQSNLLKIWHIVHLLEQKVAQKDLKMAALTAVSLALMRAAKKVGSMVMHLAKTRARVIKMGLENSENGFVLIKFPILDSFLRVALRNLLEMRVLTKVGLKAMHWVKMTAGIVQYHKEDLYESQIFSQILQCWPCGVFTDLATTTNKHCNLPEK